MALLEAQDLVVRKTGGAELEVSLPEAELPALVRRLATAGIDVYRVTDAGSSLEDLFMQWTSEAEAT